MKAIDGKLTAWYKKIERYPKGFGFGMHPVSLGEFSEYEERETWTKIEATVSKIRQSEGYEVKSFRDLIKEIAEVTINNRQFEMFYRGQNEDYRDCQGKYYKGKPAKTIVYPSIYRPEKNTDGKYKYAVRKNTIEERYDKLDKLLNRFSINKSKPIEYYFALFQHYELMPTPFIDITQSLRVAATFALRDSPTGYLYVFGLPYPNQSISHYYDLGIILIKLQNICSVEDLRPRYQEGFLVGKFPYKRMKEVDDNLARRLIAKYKLNNKDGNFWDKSFPQMPEEVLFPENDPIEKKLRDKVKELRIVR